MLYREAGQFKTSYEADAAIFPIRQDRLVVAAFVLVAFVVVPFVATPYVFTGILIPFLILSLAALGLNILTGYAGQLSLGTAAFMAVGAFATYNFMLRVPGMPILVAFALSGVVSALVGGGIEGWFPYVLALLFLLIRPEGLFGEKIIRRI